MMNDEDSKYENIIKKYTAEQLILEMSIVNAESKVIYAKKKALEDELDRRRNQGRKGK